MHSPHSEEFLWSKYLGDTKNYIDAEHPAGLEDACRLGNIKSDKTAELSKASDHLFFVNLVRVLTQGSEPLMTPEIETLLEETYSGALLKMEGGSIGLCYPNVRSGDEI
jgi:hypothetical protein